MLLNGMPNPLYIGNTWLTNNDCEDGCGGEVCSGTKGCDVCGQCNGYGNNGTIIGKDTYFPDIDNDGKGNPFQQTMLCPIGAEENGYVLNSTDTDDSCYDSPLTGRPSYDHCGFCLDTDGPDSLGIENFAISNTMLFDCKGTSWSGENCVSCGTDTSSPDNILDSCITYNVSNHPRNNAMDCAGVCLSGYFDGTGTSILGQWGAYIDTSYMDGDGDGFGNPNTGQPFCTADGIPLGRVDNNIDVDDDIDCETNKIGCEGSCFRGWGPANPMGHLNSEGECVFVIFPGDVNMDGRADATDIIGIINNWGSTGVGPGARKNNEDIEGVSVNSNIDWKPHYVDYGTVKDSCKIRADANGDGIVNIKDVLASIINSTKPSHSYTEPVTCASLPRESDIDIYFNIYKSLPKGELRNSFSEIFGFEPLPEEFMVEASYPNPFNPVTNIRYAIPEHGNIFMQIYNLNGKKIVEHEMLDLDIGYYSYSWDARNYSSGIYFLSIYFNNKLINSQKLVLIK